MLSVLAGCITGWIKFPVVEVDPTGMATVEVVALESETTVATGVRTPLPVAILDWIFIDPGRELDNVATTGLLDCVVTPGIGACALSCTACICLFKTDLWVHE